MDYMCSKHTRTLFALAPTAAFRYQWSSSTGNYSRSLEHSAGSHHRIFRNLCLMNYSHIDQYRDERAGEGESGYRHLTRSLLKARHHVTQTRDYEHVSRPMQFIIKWSRNI